MTLIWSLYIVLFIEPDEKKFGHVMFDPWWPSQIEYAHNKEQEDYCTAKIWFLKNSDMYMVLCDVI